MPEKAIQADAGNAPVVWSLALLMLLLSVIRMKSPICEGKPPLLFFMPDKMGNYGCGN